MLMCYTDLNIGDPAYIFTTSRQYGTASEIYRKFVPVYGNNATYLTDDRWRQEFLNRPTNIHNKV